MIRKMIKRLIHPIAISLGLFSYWVMGFCAGVGTIGWADVVLLTGSIACNIWILGKTQDRSSEELWKAAYTQGRVDECDSMTREIESYLARGATQTFNLKEKH